MVAQNCYVLNRKGIKMNIAKAIAPCAKTVAPVLKDFAISTASSCLPRLIDRTYNSFVLKNAIANGYDVEFDKDGSVKSMKKHQDR